MFSRAPVLLLGLAVSLGAQVPLENAGKPMHVAYDCAPADMLSAGLACSDEDPCPVYVELSNVEAIGNKIFITGNIHTPMATLYSILLASEDAGKTWTEPHARIHISGLDQIQFVDFQNGWVSGANLQGAPRDPFFLMTRDGGKTWSEHPVFDEDRVVAIERFWFDTATHGKLLIDANLDTGKHELYETNNGGENWAIEQPSTDPAQFSKPKTNNGWRIRTDAATHSYLIEKSESGHWQKVAAFSVDLATCKQ